MLCICWKLNDELINFFLNPFFLFFSFSFFIKFRPTLFFQSFISISGCKCIMYSAKLCWYIRHLESRKQCSLSREHVSIRDREKPRYTIGAWSAWSRICTMDRERYLCWTVLIGLLESRAYVSYAGAFSRRIEPLCWHWRITL